MQPTIRTGKVESDGSAENVSLGFIPDYVKVVNETDGDIILEWWKGMTDGHAIQHTQIADDGTSTTNSFEKITSNGISEYDGDSDNGQGFTIGTAIAEADKDLYYVAVRDGAIA